MTDERIEHWCEVCGTTRMLTSAEGFEAGWDFPPRMGEWGVLSPRTCGNCTIEKTLWWAIVSECKKFKDLTDPQQQVLERILAEAPEPTAGGTK